MAEFTVRAGEHGSTVTAAVGDVVKIELAENPTTGFRWQVAAVDSSVLRLQSDDFAPGGPAVGSGGLHVFHWAAAGRGGTDVRLELKRSWEAGPAKSTFAIRVSVL
jgi:inhibitor of cysteine peptidase